MENTKVTLPVSKSVAELTTSWTYREYREIELTTGQAASKVTMVNGQPISEIDMTKIAAAEMQAILITVKKITTEAGVDVPVTADAILDLTAEDGIALKRAVDAMALTQKKT